MSSAIDTTRVAERRVLHFNSLADILADVERLAQAREVRNLGNWSPGQVVNHLAVVMNKSIDGFEQKAPKIVRFFIRLFMKRRFLTKTMSPGFRLPRRAQAELVLPPVTLEEGRRTFAGPSSGCRRNHLMRRTRPSACSRPRSGSNSTAGIRSCI